MKLCTILTLLGVASVLNAQQVAAQPPSKPNYFAEDCQPQHGKYIANSTYESNLQAVLTILRLQAKTDTSSNSSCGSGGNTVYGQYYCRADISIQLCSDCVEKAELSIVKKCSTAMAAVMYYEECTLRYANQSMLGIETEDPGYHLWGVANVTDPDMFGAVLNDTRDKVVDTASNDGGPLLYTTGEGVVSPSETIYMLAQCSPDLEGYQCKTCLFSAFKFLARTDSGGEWPQFSMVFVPSCQIRYSIHGFYPLPNATTVSPAPSPVQQVFDMASRAPTASLDLKLPPSTSRTSAANDRKIVWYISRALVVGAYGLL